MQIPILIEPIAGKGYRARGGEPFALVAEGPTREAALAKLRDEFQATPFLHTKLDELFA
jgi:hypothetical protein